MGGTILLSQHPKYKEGDPYMFESSIDYALRSAAHLVSPPQLKGESNEIECVAVAKQIVELGPNLQKRWNKIYNADNFPENMPKVHQKVFTEQLK